MNGRFSRALIVAAMLLVCAESESKRVGEIAPDFSRTDVTGATLHLADFHGKLILLNFWASWCGPCLDEMPRFSQWQRIYGGRGLQVIGVSMDDERSAVAAVLKRRPVSYSIVFGDARLGDLYGGVLGLPLSFLIGADGRIMGRYQGEHDLADIESMIKHSLGGTHP